MKVVIKVVSYSCTYITTLILYMNSSNLIYVVVLFLK